MGMGSWIHWVVLMLVVVLLFGGGRISGLMGDVAKGIKSFKKGMAEDDDVKPAGRLESQKAAEPAFDRDGNRQRDAAADPIRDNR